MAVMKQFVVRYTTRQGVLKDLVGDTHESVVDGIKKLGCCKKDEERLIARIAVRETTYTRNLENNF